MSETKEPTRPKIVITQADGTTVERDMDDVEFAEYNSKIEGLQAKIDEIEAKLKVRTNKLANP
jgi:peptidoglycan hydrolase CwlO-like protein